MKKRIISVLKNQFNWTITSVHISSAKYDRFQKSQIVSRINTTDDT